MSDLKQCYNKGCGKKFTDDDNTEEVCQYHPGAPVFHDARKGWSCCNRFSTDFSEFLNFKGCAKGYHNPNKPIEEKPQKLDPKYDVDIVEVGNTSVSTEPKAAVQIERPSNDEPLVPIAATIASSLKQLIEAKKQEVKDDLIVESSGDRDVPSGTSCKNNGCKSKYWGPESNKEICFNHPGFPIFHEGMKYWSCCQRKTTEFENFMAQEGCATGKHSWFKKPVQSNVSCRFDWFQTPTFVTVSFYAKATIPEKTLIKSNGVVLDVSIDFEMGKSEFSRSFNLHGIIDPSRSNVKLLATKVEVNLYKVEPSNWPSLTLPENGS